MISFTSHVSRSRLSWRGTRSCRICQARRGPQPRIRVIQAGRGDEESFATSFTSTFVFDDIDTGCLDVQGESWPIAQEGELYTGYDDGFEESRPARVGRHELGDGGAVETVVGEAEVETHALVPSRPARIEESPYSSESDLCGIGGRGPASGSLLCMLYAGTIYQISGRPSITGRSGFLYRINPVSTSLGLTVFASACPRSSTMQPTKCSLELQIQLCSLLALWLSCMRSASPTRAFGHNLRVQPTSLPPKRARRNSACTEDAGIVNTCALFRQSVTNNLHKLTR